MTWWAGTLTAEQAALVDGIDQLCDRHADAKACEAWDRDEAFPHDAMDALGRNDWAGLPVPVEYGGAGSTAADLAIVHQALARRSLALAQAYYSLWVLGADAIARLGTPAQCEEWLPRLASGTARVAFAMTEPGAGSDAASLRSSAVRDGDTYVVNGEKVFITGAAVADTIVTAVRTTAGERRQHGVTLLMIDPATPGVTVRRLSKIGLRAIDLCQVFFDDVRVSASDVLGTVDDGWRQLQGGLARERLYLAAISLGALCDIVAATVDHATTREAFGRPIGSHQMIGSKIVRMRVAADAAAGLVAAGARSIDDDGGEAPTAAAVAKLFASEAYVSAARDGVQVFGGQGYTEDLPIARHYRDCKYLEIGGGTSEVQTIVIGRSMGLAL